MKNFHQFILRALFYTLGMLFIAFGIVFSVNADLGISPVSTLPYVISLITGKRLSICVTGTYILYIVLQFLLLRRAFQWHNMFQFAVSALFGYFVEFAQWAIGGFMIPTYPGRLLMLALSVIFIAIGVPLYVKVKLVPMPIEGLVLALAQKSKKLRFHQIKIVTDCTIVAISIILSFAFLGKLEGIREGTVIAAFAVGKAMGYLQKPLGNLIEQYCFSSSPVLSGNKTAKEQ